MGPRGPPFNGIGTPHRSRLGLVDLPHGGVPTIQWHRDASSISTR